MMRPPADRFITVRPCRTEAFTLVELLVVIAIIAILTAIAYPVFSNVQNRARTVQAVGDMRNIKTAVAAFFTDYQKYPTTPGQDYFAQQGTSNDTVFGDPGGYYRSSDLFNILRGLPDDHYGTANQANPNQTVYWQGGFAKSATAPREGITTQDVQDGENKIYKGSLVDPWGNPYVVWFNVTKSGDLTNALGWFYKDYQSETVLNAMKCDPPPLGVECAYLGPDGEWGTKENGVLKGSDDVVTWSHP